VSIKSKLRFLMAEKKINSISELQRITGLSRNALNKLFHEEGLEGLTLGTLHRICQTLDKTEIHDLVQFELPDELLTRSTKGPNRKN
jgi:putative transcriptional regulator